MRAPSSPSPQLQPSKRAGGALRTARPSPRAPDPRNGGPSRTYGVPALGEHGSGRGGSPSQRGSRGETPRPALASHPVRQGDRSGDTRRPPSLRRRGQERGEARLSAPAAGTSPSRGVLCCCRSEED